MRTLILLLAMTFLASFNSGCGQAPDGSSEFYNQHPEYAGKTPAYFTPADSDSSDQK